MREAHPVERAVGMEYYVSDAPGIGGHLRASPADFRVRELERFEAEPADADPDAYPHVLVRATLRAWDTNDFARELSNRLGVSRERVSWAGTKDKHAVTTQLFSVARVDPASVQGIEIRDADLELVGRTGRPVLFGDLAGNAFEVVIRDADAPGGVDAVTRQLAAFGRGETGEGRPPEPGDHTQDDGERRVTVPNYFGQQRFGSKRPVTHEVGLAVVRGDWKGAVLAYVGNPSEREPADTREARRYVEETRDWGGALDRLPDRLGFERSICHRLVEQEGSADYRDALEAVPTNLQRLFVNAAQSYVFNRILSERLGRGLPFHEPVAGDVVCFRDADVEAVTLPDADRTQRVTDDRVTTVTRHCERDRAFVTAPLVGTETDLAGGEPGDIERAVLDEVGLSPGDFDLPGEFGSAGTRRAVVVRTDVRVERDDGIAVAFALPKGSYATVVLREYLKTDPDVLG